MLAMTGKVMVRNEGITLIELIIVISIIGILVVALGFSFQGWIGGYKIESQIKELYVDLMNSRARAMQRNRTHFVDLPVVQPKQYTIYEDTNPVPDGNGILETASDASILQKNMDYTIIPAMSFGVRRFSFDKNGLVSNNGTIRLSSTVTPDYDCIVLFATRINMGQWNGTDCIAK
jgi:prepilin-type N-terminal cleavage/methylation domain-containing protein